MKIPHGLRFLRRHHRRSVPTRTSVVAVITLRSVAVVGSVAMLGSLAVVGCSSDAVNAGAPDGSAELPKRIVSLSPTATETLYAIGAGERVVAVDKYSNSPDSAPRTDMSGFTPDLDTLLGFSPDLVIISTDKNDISAKLTAAGVEVAHLPTAASVDQAYQQIGQLGQLTGNTNEAAQLTSDMHAEITHAIARVPEQLRLAQLTYFHELNAELHTVGNGTFIGEVYKLFGLTSIAGDGADYPKLTSAEVLAANPQLIFMADIGAHGGVDPADVANRPGWDSLDAVKNNNIFAINADLASRWGPSLPKLVSSISDALTHQATLPQLMATS